MSERVKTASNVEAVVFDLGGVLIDWDPRYLYRRIFDSEKETERFLATVCTSEWNAELDRGRSFEEVSRLLALSRTLSQIPLPTPRVHLRGSRAA